MDIRGEKVRFTPSEAHWAQSASTRFGAIPDLAQRIQDARVAFARQWLSPDELPAPIVDIRQDITTRLVNDCVLGRLQEVTIFHTAGAQGQEQPVIEVGMNREEKERLLDLAIGDYEIARRQIDTPEVVEVEDQQILDDAALFFATSDVMEPDQAVALGDMLRDPEMRAVFGPQREDAIREASVLGPIVTALEADLVQPN
jgi:hypothetical protein